MAAAPAPLIPARAHICALVEDAGEVAALAGPIIRDSLEHGEQVVAFGGRGALDALRRNVAPEPAREGTGQLRLLPWGDVSAPAPARFDVDAALDAMHEVFVEDAVTGRFPLVRLVLDMNWVVSAAGAGASIAECERGLDRLVQDHDQAALCIYDVSRLSGTLLMELLATHPLAIVRGALIESPFYREPS
jgi:hypothetical protein